MPLQENRDHRKLEEVPDEELNALLLAEAKRENDARPHKADWEALASVQV